jgi:hypothetical protein
MIIDLAIYQPTSITIEVYGKKYEGYKAPMDLFAYSLELIRLKNGKEQDKQLLLKNK